MVVTLGVTTWLPERVFEPLQPLEAVQLVAFVLLQVRRSEVPAVTVDIEGVRVTVGLGVGVGVGLGFVAGTVCKVQLVVQY